ncbi:MAG: phospholipase D-like domain-containing protein [Acidobacteriota bacterium]
MATPVPPVGVGSQPHELVGPVRVLHSPEPASGGGAPLTWLVDNADAYDRVVHALGSARRAIWITQLAFDADCMAYERPGADADASAPSCAGTLLAEAVRAAVTRAAVDVRILLNATLLLDTARPLRQFFTARIAALREAGSAVPGTIQVRGVKRFPQLLHAKMIIVDGTEAFLLGSPFANGYWDDGLHPPVDPRRPLRELAGRPVHDLSVRLTGSPVAAIEDVFTAWWDSTIGVTSDAARFPSADSTAGRIDQAARERSTKTLVRVVSTSPRRVLAGCPSGSTEILEVALEGIARARSWIYIEHQYLSARPIVAALATALARNPALELIAVLNQNPDVTAYRRWQNARLVESGLLTHPRAGLFALWTVARGTAPSCPAMLNQVFVHSKAVVVDDEWGMAGSANLDGVSLHSYGDDFTGALGRGIFRHVRNFDLNVVVDDRLDGHAASGILLNLRSRLWCEHLGIARSLLTIRPDEGWLPLWRARAAANAAALDCAPAAAAPPRMCGFVLPYSTAPTPARQLAAAGVRVNPARLEVCFNPGWLEVNFSPNWIRNMFS